MQGLKEELKGDVEIMIENSPVGEHQSNGEVESIIGSTQGYIRTLKDALETSYDTKISP